MKLTKLAISLPLIALALHAQTTQQATQPRLICLFLNLNSMDAAAQTTARDAAIQWVQQKLQPADLVSVIASGSQTNVLLDFTQDRGSVVSVLRNIMPDSAARANNDPQASLQALEAVSSLLAKFPEKKVMIYISGGVSKVGADDQAQMEAAVNALMKADIVMYPLDARGLLAPPPQ